MTYDPRSDVGRPDSIGPVGRASIRYAASMVLCALILTVGGCDSTEPEPTGSFSLKLNGVARGSSGLDQVGLVHNPSYGFFLNMQLATEDHNRTHGIVVTLPALSEDTYSLFAYERSSYVYQSLFFEGYDGQPAGTYEIVSERDSLTIVDYNASTGYVKATFAGTYVVRNPHAPFRTLPDTLRITEGVVEVFAQYPADSR